MERFQKRGRKKEESERKKEESEREVVSDDGGVPAALTQRDNCD